VTVQDFGAKGDGKTDDTHAIQSALDSTSRMNGFHQRASVFMPPGVYCSRQLQMRANTALIGVPAYDYRQSGGTEILLIDPSASCLIDVSDTQGVTIDGLSLNGNKHLGKTVHGVLRDDPDPLTHPSSRENAFRIDRSQIAFFSGDGVRMVHSWCWSIRHSMVAHNDGDGINMVGWDFFMLDCWLSGNRGVGFASNGQGSSAMTLTANRIEWNRLQGILLTGDSSFLQVTGNYLDRNSFSGIAFLSAAGGTERCEHITLTGNFFYRNGATARANSAESSQLRLEGARGVACVGNSFHAGGPDFNGQGEYSPSYGVYYRNLENCVITNNVLHEGATVSLFDGNPAEDVLVSNNPGSLLKIPSIK
jgi:hypothetical protein